MEMKERRAEGGVPPAASPRDRARAHRDPKGRSRLTGHIPQETIEEIKSRAQIVDIVSEYVTLRKRGRNYIGLCPFHREKTPSFTVNPEKQIFYCFGCGEGGNVISFLMKMNTMTFPEAVRSLAGKVGVIIPVSDPTPGEKKKISEREAVHRINMAAAEFFFAGLSSKRGRNAREYLKKRGISDPVVKKYFLGHAPDEWRELKGHFEKKGIPLELAGKAGLIVFPDTGQPYDRFRNRLIFPIQDLNGKVVAFGGRILGEGEPKYLNSPESPVYTKGRTLYGLYQSRDDVRRADAVIIVEGYFDLLALWNAGVTNVAATLGTALTRDQAALIRRFTRNVIMIFDPDEAGIHAVERGLQIFLEEQMEAKIVILPDKRDPADFVSESGGDALRGLIGGARSMVDYYIDHVIGGKKTLEEKLRSARESVSFFAGIADPIQRGLFIRRVAERLGIEEALLTAGVSRLLSKPRGTGEQEPPERRRKKVPAVDSVELNLLHLMMEYPGVVDTVVTGNVVEWCLDEDVRDAAWKLIDEWKRGTGTDAGDFVAALPAGSVREGLLKRMVESPCSDDVVERMLQDTIRKIRSRWYRRKHQALKMKLAEAQKRGDADLLHELLREKDGLIKEERGLSEAGGGEGPMGREEGIF